MATNDQPDRGSPLSNCKAIAIVAVVLIYYAPLFFPPTAVVVSHDNLDSTVVINRIIAAWIRDSSQLDLAINGNLHAWALPGVAMPLTYLYLIDNPWVAYLTNDIIVRLVALIGALLLSKAFHADKVVSAIAALCFAFSISYTAYGFSVAGLPLIVWILYTLPTASGGYRIFLYCTTILIGWNSSLFLSGVFFLILAVPLFSLVMKERPSPTSMLGLTGYAFGLTLGGFNIIYGQLFSGMISHRTEFGNFVDLNQSNLTSFARSLRDVLLPKPLSISYPWYHVSSHLTVFLAIGGLIAVTRKETRKQGFWALGAYGCIAILYAILRTPAIASFRHELDGVLKTFQFDRFYFLSSFLCLCIWLLASRGTRLHLRFMTVFAACQLGLVVSDTPHWRQVVYYVFDIEGKRAGSSFSEYYKFAWFEKVTPLLNHGAVMSVGLDPMIAPMNHIRSIDGYYPIYPLTYKHQFRKVINNSLLESGQTNYFDGWGSRIYTFHAAKHPEHIDFCAGQRLGALHVISGIPISSSNLRNVEHSERYGIYLYEIDCSTFK